MEYIEEFKKELIREEKSKNTIDNYLRAIVDYSKFIEGRTGDPFNPKEIIELDIKEYKSYLLTIEKQSPSTINTKLSGLSKFCDYLAASEVLTSNPVNPVKKVKVQANNTSPQTLSKNDLYKLRREFHKGDNKRDIAIFELLYNTGVRVSELCAIELDDVEISERKGTLVVRSGKGSKYRTIPINANARKAISDYLAVRPLTTERKLILGQRGSMGRDAIFRVLKGYAEKAGVGGVHPHTLRHQFCKELINQGIDIVTVANLAGHNSISTTAIYTQPSEDEKVSALDKL